jgi:hypothetical protein
MTNTLKVIQILQYKSWAVVILAINLPIKHSSAPSQGGVFYWRKRTADGLLNLFTTYAGIASTRLSGEESQSAQPIHLSPSLEENVI